MKTLIFGASGSAGGSVLRACLAAPKVTEVRAVVRRPLKIQHPKLRVVTHENFLDFSAIDMTFDAIDACMFCLGVSSLAVRNEADYRRITYDFALAAARTLKQRSPGAAFHFISGRSTDPTSTTMWARVKGQAENDLMKLVGAVCWRPAAIDGEAGETRSWYSPLRPVFKLFAPFRSMYVRGDDLGRAMLQATEEKIQSRTIENPEIRDLADRAFSYPRVS